MRLKKIIKKCFMVLVVFLMISILIGILLAYIPSRMTKKHTNEIVELFLNDMNYDLLDFNNKYGDKTRDIKLSSQNAHLIPVKYILIDKSFDNTVVLYDQRAHGGNTAKTVTFGYYLESAHSLQHLDFAIMESPFSSMYSEIKWNIETATKVKLPTTYLLKLGSIANNLLFGYTYEEVSIVESMKKNMVPTMVLHSKNDMVCPYYMGEDLYNVSKKIFIILLA